jgi:hypothetical protein
MLTFMLFLLVMGYSGYVDASKAAKNPELTVGAGKFLFGIFGKK